MRATGKRRAPSAMPERRPPPTPTIPATPNDPWHYNPTGRRDSDASFASSRPSSAGINSSRSSNIPVEDRSYQKNAIRTVNDYLHSHNLPILKTPYPSAKDITETLKFILSRFGFGSLDDFFNLLKYLNCPLKLNKSALKAPAPHSWPSLLAVIHWLVQICKLDEHRLSGTRPPVPEKTINRYAIDSYKHYVTGNDDQVDELDRQFVLELQQEKERLAEEVSVIEGEVKALEVELEAMKNGPSAKEAKEQEKSELEEDVKKFHDLIEKLEGQMMLMKKALEEKEKALETKIAEKECIRKENEELKKTVEEQGIDSRKADSMKRELQALERDIEDTENKRVEWEEKAWDLDSAIRDKYKKLEELMIDCNQSIRRLKLGNELQYQLNAQGSSPAKVLGIDYKTKLKPMLASFDDEMKKSSMAKLEELISLQQQSLEKASKVESKRKHLDALQAQIDMLEDQMDLVKKEARDFTSKCATEAKKIVEELETETRNMDLIEGEAADFLKASKAKLQETIKQTEEEVQKCARELYAVVDMVSKYKEYIASKAATMKHDLAEAVGAVAAMHKAGLPGSSRRE